MTASVTCIGEFPTTSCPAAAFGLDLLVGTLILRAGLRRPTRSG
jgi:hypothetical protein